MKPSSTWQDFKRQVFRVGTVIVGFLALGTFGYYLLGLWLKKPANLLDCLYMTLITLTTVGYEEVIEVAKTKEGRLFSSALILLGVGTLLYALSQIAFLLLEGALFGAWERWRMEREIGKLRDHYIVCGAGRVGEAIIRELVAIKRPAVLIDRNAEIVLDLAKELKVPFIIGDATEEATLKAAGIERAFGLLAALGNDHDNLFLVITARSLNPGLRIVARGNEASVVEKMRRAGADEVILPERIGGLRMVSMMVRPTAVSFIDRLFREQEQILRLEEVRIGEDSSLAGKRLADAQFPRRWSTLVLAYSKDGRHFIYNPSPDTVLEPGMTLIVMGDMEKVHQLRRIAAGREKPKS